MNNTIKIHDPAKLKTSKLLAQCTALFPTWSYYDNDRLDRDFPIPKEPTTRYFLKEVEPDKETLGKSAKEADPEMRGITVRERIIMELEYFKETGEHLDIEGITFCSGSRDSDGGVLYIYWDGGRFEVSWFNLDSSFSGCGIRSAVALESSSLVPLHFDAAVKIVKEAGYKITREKIVIEEL